MFFLGWFLSLICLLWVFIILCMMFSLSLEFLLGVLVEKKGLNICLCRFFLILCLKFCMCSIMLVLCCIRVSYIFCFGVEVCRVLIKRLKIICVNWIGLIFVIVGWLGKESWGVMLVCLKVIFSSWRVFLMRSLIFVFCFCWGIL